MDHSSYYNCTLFDKTINNLNYFSFIQKEAILDNVTNNKKAKFEIKNVEYKCSYKQNIAFDIKKPVAIIPIKDNKELLKFTFNNLKTFNIFDHINFLIVDDRSEENIKEICEDYPVNYLRVDNDKGFNFSTLNNIAAKIVYDLGCTEIILWNSDLWVNDDKTIKTLVELHKNHGSTITGTKLIYPNFSWNNEEVSHNIKTIFSSKSQTYRGTIQFGGSFFVPNTDFNTYFPLHCFRFSEKDYYKANVNKLSEFVTGAFQIIDLKWFIENGGLNPSLSKNFQDVDICLRANEQEKKVMYFGEDLYLFHNESVILSKNKNDHQFISDNFLYSKIWNIQRILKILIGQ